VSLQNGLGNLDILVGHLGIERVGLGVTTGGATLLGPGHVRAAGDGTISLEKSPRIRYIKEALTGAGFSVETVQGVISLAWSKLVINAAINPVAAILDVPNGELLARPAAWELSAALATEVASVAAQKQISLSFKDPLAAAEEVARLTAANYSSMLQDIRRGAPTEIDAICGAVVQSGREVGVPTPVNEVMWKLIKAKSVRS
jgi:2-dehydropantoate 2-reductase